MDKGYYLYAMSKDTGVRHDDLITGLSNSHRIPGIDEANPVEVVSSHGFDAFVSQVNLDEFGQEPIKRNLQDLKWLEAKARRHDHIVRELNEFATIVPVRFGTVFLSHQRIKDYLGQIASQLKGLLDRLEGYKEMGVTLDFDTRLVTEHLEQTDNSIADLAKSVNSAGSGAAYLMRKRLEKAKQEKLGSFIDKFVNDAAETLRRGSSDVKQSSLNAHPDNRWLLYVNLACLVPADKLETFATEAGALKIPSDSGISMRVTGPWPPYSFSIFEEDSRGDLSHVS